MFELDRSTTGGTALIATDKWLDRPFAAALESTPVNHATSQNIAELGRAI